MVLTREPLQGDGARLEIGKFAGRWNHIIRRLLESHNSEIAGDNWRQKASASHVGCFDSSVSNRSKCLLIFFFFLLFFNFILFILPLLSP